VLHNVFFSIQLLQSHNLNLEYAILTQINIDFFKKKYFFTPIIFYIIFFLISSFNIELLKIKFFYFLYMLSTRMAQHHDPNHEFAMLTQVILLFFVIF
jgi:hypothetical protein